MSIVQQTPFYLNRLREQISHVIVGAEEHARLALIALMCRGNFLLEGVPGTGKTLFAKCLSRLLGLHMRRLQCTPDLMPGDVLGANIFDFRTQHFTLTKGPVFTEFLLADEINRASPKTQSALLEAMQERQVTIDGTTHPLSSRFTVIATQNPIEHEGTYPLPDAQLDRFLFKLEIGYPSFEEEVRAVQMHADSSAAVDINAVDLPVVLSGQELDQLQHVPAHVQAEESIIRYAVSLGKATREHPSLSVGLSPRALTALVAAARAAAACEGRNYAIPDDVKSVFAPLARHRLQTSAAAEMESILATSVIDEILEHTPAPR